MKRHFLTLLMALIATTLSIKAQTIVIDDGFENGILDSIWTQEFVVGNTPWAVEDIKDGLEYPATVWQGSKRAYLRNNTGETQGYKTRLVSKVMDLTKVYQPELTFWYANPKWTADRDTLRVLYRTGAKAKWQQLKEFSSASANWQKVYLVLPEITETYQIAFEGTDNLGRGIVLDSIKLRSAPECTVPHDVNARHLGSGKVNIAWSASWDADSYALIVTKAEIDPDTVANVPDSLIVFNKEVETMFQNQDVQLTSGEYYYVYLRSICGNEKSAWNSDPGQEGVYHFRVKATKYLPYSYDFNTDYTANKFYRDPEWTWGNNTGHDNPHICSNLSSTDLKKYSYDGTTCLVFTGTNSATTVIPAGQYAYVATPGLADSTVADFKLNTCQVSFWSTVHQYTGKYAHSIIVGVMTDPEDITTFVPVDTVSVWGQKVFQENIVDLGSYQGNGEYVAFLSAFDKQNIFYIDNMKIEQKPAVNKVTKISVNPRDVYATISWEGNAPSYRVLVAKEELDLKAPKLEDILVDSTLSATSFVCEGLEANHSWDKPYYVYVKAEGKDWSYRYPFVTIAGEQELPMKFDMEEKTGFYPMNGVNYPNNIGVFSNDPEYPHLYKTNPYKDKGCLYLSKGAGNDSWITFPMLDSIQDKQITFYLSGNTTPAQVHATVGVMTNPMDINTFIPVADFANTDVYVRCYTSFTEYTGPKGLIAIVWSDTEDGKNTNNYIDNVTIEQLSSCVPPKSLSIEPAASSVAVSWEANGAEAWEVAIVERLKLGAAQQELSLDELAALEDVIYTDTILAPATGNPNFEADSLDFVTPYYVYVRALCGEDKSWFAEADFKTACPEAYPAPYEETCEYFSAGNFGCWLAFDGGTGSGYPMTHAGSSGMVKDGLGIELWSTSTSHRNWIAAPKVDLSFDDMLLRFHARSWSSSAKSILYVGLMSNPADTATFVVIDTLYIPNGTKYHEFAYDMEKYKAYEGQYIVFSSGMYSKLEANSDVIIDNIAFKSKRCAAPYGLEATDVQTTSLDIEWKGLTDDKWEVKVLNKYAKLNTKLNKIAPYDSAKVAIINDTIVENAALHIDGLTPKTKYYIYIRPTCGDSIWAVDSLKSGCVRINPNVVNKETFENFESGTSYDAKYQADCWTATNAYTSASTSYLPHIYKSTTYAASGENTYKLYGYASGSSQYNPVWLATPEIECESMSELTVSFSYYMATTSTYALLCGVMSDPDDLNTFIVLDSINPGAGKVVTKTYELQDYADSIPSDARYFAWRTPVGVTTTAYIDDVSILRMKCPMVKPSYSDLTADRVRINSGLREDNDWILLITNKELLSDSLNSPTYTFPDSIIVRRDTVDSRSKLVVGLEEKKNYYVAIASYCGEDVDPYWVTSSFETPCKAVNPEGMGTILFSKDQGYITGSGADRYLPCWKIGNKSGNASATSTYIPYVYTTTDYMHNGNNVLRLYAYVPTSATSTAYNGAYAIMPQLDVDSIKDYQVNFFARVATTATYNDKLIVGIISDPSDLNTFTVVDTLTLSRAQHEAFTVPFDKYEGDYLGNQGKYIMFLAEVGSATYISAFVSEISVEKIPSCKRVETITLDSIGDTYAYISIESEAPMARLLIANKALADSVKASYDKWIVDSIVTKYDSILVENLDPATSYYVYAQNICSESDSSKISIACAQLRTDCPVEGGLKVPLTEDFESYATGTYEHAIGCWDAADYGTVTGYPKIGKPTSGAVSGNQVELWSTSTTHRNVIIMPKVQGKLVDYMLSFDARSYSTSGKSVLYVGTMDDVLDSAAGFAPIDTLYMTTGNTFYHKDIILADYADKLTHGRIAFSSGLAETLEMASDMYMDNVRLGMPPSCYAPTLEAGSTTLTTAEVKITPAEQGGSLWELAVLTDSAYQKIDEIKAYLDTVKNTVMADSMNYVVPGLKDGTKYQIFARTVCGGEDGSSDWTKTPLMMITQYYYKDSYTFGFEKKEGGKEDWIRSPLATSDTYYQHPALIFDKDTVGTTATSYSYYPYQIENTSSYIYAYGPKDAASADKAAALRFYAYKSGSTSYYSQYVIFPSIEEPKARSFEFKARNCYLTASTMKPYTSSNYPAHFQVGTIEKGKGLETFELVADIKMPKLTSDEQKVVASEANDYLFKSYTFDFDSATMANRQMIIYQPEVDLKDGASYAWAYIDNVKVGEVKGYSSLGIASIEPADTFATVNWTNLGGPWNLYITGTHYDELLEEDILDTVAKYLNLTATSQVVEKLEENKTYTAILAPAVKPAGVKYELEARRSFKTKCTALEPDADGAFFWDFDDPKEWERSDVLPGSAADTAYYKPGCFTVGTTYSTPTSAAQYDWLIQRKGMNYSGAPTYSSTYAHYEYGRKDSKALRVYSSSSSYASATVHEYLVLPLLNCDLDTMMIEFWGRCFANYDNSYSTPASRKKSVGTNSYNKSLVLGTLTDPNDFSTLEILDTLAYTAYTGSTQVLVTNDPTGNEYWQKMQTPLGGAKGKYIVLYQTGHGTFFLDDLSVKPVGDNIFAPSKPVTESIGLDTATVSWQVKHPTLQSVVVLQNDNEEEIFRDTIVGTSFTFRNLQPATIYAWYMYQINGENKSSETARLQFTTECLSVTPDYATGFEQEEGWWLVPGQTSDTYKQNKCWVYGNALTGAWSSSYEGYNQLNTSTLRYSHSGDYALRMEAYSTTHQPYAAMPALDVAAFDTLQINFWMRPAISGTADHSSNPNKISSQYTLGTTASTADYYYSRDIIVGTMTDPNDASTFVPIDTIGYIGTLTVGDEANAQNDYLFQKKKVGLRGATGPYVAFMTTLYMKGETRKSTYSYMWLDDISFSKLQECEEPVNLTTSEIGASSAKLSWEGSALTQKYILQVSTDATYYYDTAFVVNDTVEATSYVLTDLKPYTQYAWRVRALCGEEYGESEFTSNALFRTVRIPFYLEDFRDASLESEWDFGTTPALQVLDSAEAVITGSNNTSYGFKRITNSYGINGPHYCVPFYSYSTVTTTTYDYYWMISPVVYLPDTLNAHLTLDLALTQCSSGYTPTANPITADDVDEYDFFGIMISDDGGKTYKKENAVVWNDALPGAYKLSDVPATAQNWRFDLNKYAGKNIRIAFYRQSETYHSKGSAMHIGNIRVAYYDNMKIDTTACQYEDIEAYGFFIDGDNATTGDHTYNRWTRASESDVMKGVRDTMYTLKAFVNEAPESFVFDTICEGDTYSDTNFSGKDRPGVYRRKLQSCLHCDSIITLNLFVANKAQTNEFDTICFGESLNWHGKICNRTGLYYDSLTTIHGCDSVVILSLKVRDQINATDTQEICLGASYIWGGKSYDKAGDYVETFTSVTGCDSIVKLHLIVSDIIKGKPQVETVCHGQTFTWNSKVYDQTGIYKDTLHSKFGCDSIATLDLTIAPIIVGPTAKFTICQGGSYTWNGKVYDKKGTYRDTLVNAKGCDSIASIEISIASIIIGEPQKVERCEGSVYTWNGKVYDKPGTYKDTVQSSGGCDSVATIILSFKSLIHGEAVQVSVCDGEQYSWNGKLITKPGTYMDTMPSSAGCDSIATLVLTYYGAEDTIRTATKIALADLPFTYQNADHPYASGQAPITYPVGTAVGIYSDTVKVEGAHCEAVLIHTLTVVEKQEGLDDAQASDIELLPNIIRAGESVTAHGNFAGTVRIQVYDIVGRLVQEESNNATSIIRINAFPQTGLYTVRISDSNGTRYVGRVLAK